MVVAVSRCAEAAFLCAAGVIRVGGGGDRLQIAPWVGVVDLSPTVGRTDGVRRGREGGGESIQGVVGESLGASGIEIVGYEIDVAGVVGGDGVDESVSDINGVAAS